jgi:CRP/FNR family transcriptional regulator, cyclic AMP receptor protein
MPAIKKNIAFDPKLFLSKIGSGRTNEKYSAHDVVFSQGDAASAVYYLQKGKAKITVTSEAGKEAVLAILAPGDFFGEGCLNGQPRRLSTVTAMVECSIMRIEKAGMIRVLHDEPKFADLFIMHLLHRNGRVEEDLVDQLFNSSEKRLARTLLLLANFGKDSKPEPVIAKISQETLAEMIGTTRSRVSFFMNKFRRLGFIDYNGDTHGNLHVNTSLLNMVLRDGELNGNK